MIEGHDYKFRVKAVNKLGESLPLIGSDSITAKDPFAKPDKPGTPEVTDWDKDHVDLEWTPPKKDGGSPVKSYIIEKRNKYGPWEKCAEVPGNQTKVTVPDLTEGEEYEFRVIAVNKGGQGEPSDPSKSVTAKARYQAPVIDSTYMQDLIVRVGQKISYSIPIEASPKPKATWSVDGKTIEPNSRADMTVTNMSVNFEITHSLRTDTGRYTLTLVNDLGTTSCSANVTVLDRPSPPQGPLIVGEVTKQSCHLSWKSPKDDGGSPILHYIIEKMDTTRGTWSDAGMSTSLNHDVPRLIHKKEYLFRVKAVNAIGESEPLELPDGVIIKNKFDEPSAPGKPQVVDWDEKHVDLEWPQPKSDGGKPITGYIVQKKEKGSPYWSNAVTVPGNKTKCSVPDLVEGQDYEFRVIAVNDAGQSEPSEPSDVITAKPRHLAPKIITPMNEIRVRAGNTIHADINFIGEPIPEVTWLVGTSPVPTDSRTSITSIGCHTILHIVDSKRSDSGAYRLQLKNDWGSDEGSLMVNVLDRPGPPEEPFEYEEVTAQSVTLSWKPPKDNGGSEITAYVIEKKDLTHGGGWVPALQYVNAKFTHATVPRLIEGTKYEFRVMAENMQGRSDPLKTSKPIVAKAQFDIPGKPGKPELVDSDKDHITIKWSPPISNGGSPIIGYEVERREKMTGRWVKLTPDPKPGTEFTDDRVQEGRSYEYRVVAVNAAGHGKPSDTSNVFIAKPMKEKPKLHLDGLIGKKIRVRAGEPINVVIPISGAPKPKVEWFKGSSPISESYRVSMGTTTEETRFRVENSTRDDAGFYTIKASNEFGKDSADIEVIVVDRPGIPTGPLEYKLMSPDTLGLEWQPPKDDGGSEITGYVVEYSEFGGDAWRPAQGFGSKCTFTAKNLVEGKKYVFRVRAENLYGVSEPLDGSPVIAKSPFDPPDAPSQPQILSYTPTSCNLTWNPPAYTGGKPITGTTYKNQNELLFYLQNIKHFIFRFQGTMWRKESVAVSGRRLIIIRHLIRPTLSMTYTKARSTSFVSSPLMKPVPVNPVNLQSQSLLQLKRVSDNFT